MGVVKNVYKVMDLTGRHRTCIYPRAATMVGPSPAMLRSQGYLSEAATLPTIWFSGRRGNDCRGLGPKGVTLYRAGG